MKSSTFRKLLIVLVLTTFAPSASWTQVLYGSLTGTVTDPSGASVPGTRIQVQSINTGITKEAVTDDRGSFQVGDLQQGVYKVTLEAHGFAVATVTDVHVDQNQVRRLDMGLQLASTGQDVTVSAAAATLQTDRADVNNQISAVQTANLPMGGGRSFQSIFKTLPGFTAGGSSTPSSSGNPAGSVGYNVNGATAYGNNTKVDGASDIFPWQPQNVMMVPPAESIEAVNVATSSLDAEQGGAVGAAINVTLKSGTNQFHGAAWEYHTNSDLKARNYFYYGASNPKNILNQFGLNIGGPIKKNKLFFFADWERYMQRTLYSGFQTVPTDALRQGNFNGTATSLYDPNTGTSTGTGRTQGQFQGNTIPMSRMSPAALKMIALIPEPNVPSSSGISNNYFYAANWAFTRDNVDLKINYNISDKSTMFVRYGAAPHTVYDPQTLGAAGGAAVDGGQFTNGEGLTQHVSIGGTHTFTPTLLFDGNVAFSRLRLSVINADAGKNIGTDVLGIPGTNGPSALQGGIPQFSFTGFSTIGDANSSTPLTFRDNLWVETANLSWVKGSHNLRFGAEVDHILMADYQANSTVGVRGGFTFSGGLTALNASTATAPNQYNSWADFLLGLPSAMNKDVQYIDPAVVAENEFFFYARDQWQVNRKLTFSYGLRWEIYPYSHGEHGIEGIQYNPSTNLVNLKGSNVDTGKGLPAPRAGIAYRINDKTVLRVGFGINVNTETFRNNIQTYPDVISLQYSAVNSFSAAGNLATGIPAFVGPNLSAAAIPLPANVGSWIYPSPFRRGYAESYNVTLQRDIGLGFNLQAGFVGNRDIRPESGVDLNAAGPGQGKNGQPYYQLWGNSSRIASLSPIDNSRYNSLQTRLTRRTTSKGTFGISYTFSKAMNASDSETGGSLMWNWAPVQYRNYSLAGYDRTHNFQFYYVYSLPFGKGQKFLTSGVGALLAGGWQLNGILSRASGTPFSVSSSGTSLNAPSNTQTANQVVQNVNIIGGHGPNSPYFDPNAFAAVTTVSFGNTGRNIVRGPGLFNLDASLFRDFAVREWFKLQFRAEAFGLTNTPTFANPSATVSNATFTNGVLSNLNGYDTITTASGERQLRFALKLTF